MDMLDILRAIRQLEQPAVLATIVEVEGHAYRKAGAAMLLKWSGETVGTVSPGCIESDLLERVPAICEANQYEMVEYNMQPDEDPIWGESVGCGGVIRILLEPVEGELRELLLTMLEHLNRGLEVQLSREIRDQELCYELCTKDTAVISTSNDWRYSMVLKPRQRVILFGAGLDAIPIYHLLTQSSFRVIVADWRPGLLASFSGAEIALGTPGRLEGELQLHENDAVIVCSHHLHYDREMIHMSLAQKARYIGVMGSSKRINMLFEGENPPANVKAPIGLSIGAEGPYEIAVSITAELIALRKEWLNKNQQSNKEARNDHIRNLFGGGAEQSDGQTEAAARAFPGLSARQYGASCSIG
ncbi:XdhC family protein [Paenibacillus sp. YAF4_2]|uniref:XdhC family protein n=1 Tax=Paenibacillus sp. YAF4_2 TaxID=3233085 RepID=UPI003F94A802